MKRFPLFGLMILLVLTCSTQASLAQTFAYIPYGDNNVTRLDPADETFDGVGLPESADATDTPYGAAVTPNGVYLLVTRRGDLVDPGTLTFITVASFNSLGAQTHRTVGVDPRGVAVESRGLFAYVANFGDDTLSRISMATLSVTGSAIDTGDGPIGVAAIFDEVDDIVKIYVTNNLEDTVSVITDDGTTATNEADLTVGSEPVGIAVSPDGRFVYVANNASDTVTIIQTSDNSVIGTLDVGVEPWGVAVGADGDFAYVTNSGSLDSSVSVINTATRTVQSTLGGVDQPMGVAAPRNGDFAIVANQGDGSITRIDSSPAASDNFSAGAVNNVFALGAWIGDTPPSAPSDLTATEKSSDEIDLAWTDNADDETGFKIERRADNEDGFTQIAEVVQDVTIYNDGGLSGETTYHYRVRAFNEAADSVFSAEANALTEEGQFSWCFIQTLLH